MGGNQYTTKGRTKRVEVLYSAAEHRRLSELAARAKAKSVSEYVRVKSLSEVNTNETTTKDQTMKTTIIALLIAVFVSACGQEPLPGEDPAQGRAQAADATPAPSPTPDATPPADATPTPDATPAPDGADRCTIPDGYTLVLKTCTYTAASNVCIAQNSDFIDSPPGTIKINLAGCHLDARPNVVCVTACPPN